MLPPLVPVTGSLPLSFVVLLPPSTHSMALHTPSPSKSSSELPDGALVVAQDAKPPGPEATTLIIPELVKLLRSQAKPTPGRVGLIVGVPVMVPVPLTTATLK